MERYHYQIHITLLRFTATSSLGVSLHHHHHHQRGDSTAVAVQENRSTLEPE